MGRRYPIRALKYFLFLVVLFIFLFLLMLIFRQSSWHAFLIAYGSWRIWGLAFIFIGLPLLQPLFGYVGRDVPGSFAEKRQVIDRVLAMSGYTITAEAPDKIVAHAASGIKKLSLLFEDRIEIRHEGNHYIRIDGPRKEVAKIEFRMRTFMNT